MHAEDQPALVDHSHQGAAASAQRGLGLAGGDPTRLESLVVQNSGPLDESLQAHGFPDIATQISQMVQSLRIPRDPFFCETQHHPKVLWIVGAQLASSNLNKLVGLMSKAILFGHSTKGVNRTEPSISQPHGWGLGTDR